MSLFLLALSASAQNQRSSASQVVSITIQKVTLLKFKHVHQLASELTQNNINEDIKENKKIQQKEILDTVFYDETYVKRKEEPGNINDQVTVTTQTSL